ncbi:MAG: RNA 2',3'-cyclic phosphodiesterase [Desulfomonilaceae bacterium]
MAHESGRGAHKSRATSRDNPMVRCFVALELPEEVKSFVAAVAAELRLKIKDAKWVSVQGMHLTLKFLGDVPSGAIPAVGKALEEPFAVRGPIQLKVQGLGCFPNMKRPRVIWLGITDSQSALQPLVQKIEDALVPLGIPRETRSFKPHLTLARMKDAGDLSRDMEFIMERQTATGPSFSINSAVLFESVLRPQGAQYHPIKRFSFLDL